MPMPPTHNRFLQNSRRRIFSGLGLPLPEDSEKSPDVDGLASCKGKMRFNLANKMLGTNTWNKMKMVDKAMPKLAETKEAFVPDWVKRNTPEAIKKPFRAVRDTMALPGKVNELTDQVKNVVGDVDTQGATLANTLTELRNSAKSTNAFMENMSNTFRPYQDMMGSFGRGLAGTFGVEGYQRPQWLQRFIDFLRNLFYSKSASYGTPTTVKDAILLALNGTDNFQKSASIGSPVPDTTLHVHIHLATRMEKAAELMADDTFHSAFAPAFKAAASKVRMGYPARQAINEEVGRSPKLAAAADEVLVALACDLFLTSANEQYKKRMANC